MILLSQLNSNLKYKTATITSDDAGYLYLSRDIADISNSTKMLLVNNVNSQSAEVNLMMMPPWQQYDNYQWNSLLYDSNLEPKKNTTITIRYLVFN